MMIRAFLSQYILTTCLLILFMLSFNNVKAQHKFEISTSINLVDAEFNPYKTLQPGDTIWLLPGIRRLLILRNIHGSSNLPITIINQGKVEFNSNHYFGISIRHCSFIHLSGEGDTSIKYGISIFNIQGTALGIGDFSTDFEINNIEIGNSLYSGITAKTEPDCDFNRNNFVQKNTVIHDCYIHHSGTESMYIGSSFYNGQTLICNGRPKVVLPALLSNVKIYNNLIEYSGWDGIQVSSAINTQIYNNKIYYDSQKQVDWQMTGIILGEGSTGSIFNNLIKDGEGTGILDNGLGDIKIYNNIILNPGKNNEKPSSNYGIYIDDKSSFPQMFFSVYNNLILNPRKEGVRMLSNLSSNKNIISNNIIIKSEVISNPAIQEKNYILTIGNPVIQNANFCTGSLDQLFFVDALNDNFNLQSISPVIDAGSKIIDSEFSQDYYLQPREQGNGLDIGPVESKYTKNNNYLDSTQLISDIVYPNPIEEEDYFTIEFSNDLPALIKFNLVDQLGAIKKQLGSQYFINGNHQISFESKQLEIGLNLIQISKARKSKLIRVVKKESSK